MEEQQRFRAFTSPWLRIEDFTLAENLPTPVKPHISASPQVDLGSLDALPLEILQLILVQLDLRTITDFRRVNRRAFRLVTSIPQYSAINKHAYDTLRGILGIGTAHWITCETLYSTLCTAECERCGDFGGYVYILTCRRVCFLCVTQEASYLPLPDTHAIQKFGLNLQILKMLPHMRSIPGKYSPQQERFDRRNMLVDSDCARQAGIALHGSVAAMEKYVSDIADQTQRQHANRLSRQSFDSVSASQSLSAPRCLQNEGPFSEPSGHSLRFMAILRTPWLNRISQKVEIGSYCCGCQSMSYSYHKSPMHFRRQYTVSLFNEHLRQCGSIKYGKHHRNMHKNRTAQ